MSFDFEDFETNFETQKKLLENRILQIQKQNDNLMKYQSIKQEQLREIKSDMKLELQEIKSIIASLEITANKDQKFLLKQIKQKILKLEEHHKAIVKQLIKQSISEQFDRLSMQESQFIQENQVNEQQRCESKPKSLQNSIPNSLPKDEQILITQSKKQSGLSLSLKQPLLEVENEQFLDKRDSSDKDSKEIEQQVVQQLNQEYIEYQNMIVEQENLDKYNQEIDQLVTFQKSDKKCFKYSIISAIVLIILAFLYTSIWLCNTIYEMVLGIEQLFCHGIEFAIILCFLSVQYLQKTREQLCILVPILLLLLNVVIILSAINQERFLLFLLPPLIYDTLNKNETKRYFFLICKVLHLVSLCIWKVLLNLNNGQPIVIIFILILFALVNPKEKDRQLKRNDTDFDDTIHIRTNSDSDRLQEMQNNLIGIIKLDWTYNLIMSNSRAHKILKNTKFENILESPVISIDKSTKQVLQDQFSVKFSSGQDLKEFQQVYTLREVLEQLKQVQKYPYEFEVFCIKGYNDLYLKIFIFDCKSFTIILQNLEEYKLQIKKVFTQTTIQQLFKSFSHEYNTSLNYILALAQVAECHKQVPKCIKEQYFKPILANGRVMHSMVLDMMDYNSILGKTFSLEVSHFNIKELILEVISLFKDQIKKKNLEIEFENNIQIQEIISDKNRIKQILINLVSNAQKFTLHGNIRLRVEEQILNKKNQEIIFHVQDTGIGMTKDEQQRLVLLLQQGVPSISKISKNTAGFGLGLFISNKIAETLSQQRYEKGGGLRFETQTGKGFHCWFSVYHQIVSPSIKPNNPKSPLVLLNKKVIIDTRQSQVNAGIEHLRMTQMRSKFSHLLNNKVAQIQVNQIRERRSHDQIKFVQKLINGVSQDSVNKECSIDEYQNRIKYMKSQGQQQKQLSQQPSQTKINIDCHCPSILIVDDEQINIMALSILLEQFKLSSDQVFNGKECVDLIFSNQKKTYCSRCSDKQYQLIFMDINMPILDGWEASRQIKKKFKISIIACTAFTDNETKEQCYQNGIDYYISKPVKKDSLAQVLQYYDIL
ncbi:unnamed protein product [Paramecium sonneborni]|uniref:Histidine kinase n=1 Tax=Paramecium sonneborni TaxID=65129 RepID=A0A8S1NAF4_9CILI|nr:unnamed protein product [Paramecium sonneborni]